MTMEKCFGCNEEVDTDGDFYSYSNVKDETLCESCYLSDLEYASIVHIVDGDSVQKYYIGNYTHMTEFGDDLYGTNLTIKRTWISTDAWRGHNETTIEGWSEVLTGWTTGGWDDFVARSKQKFNQWAQSLLTLEIIPPVPVAIVSDPTSNVFSTGISVLSPQPNELKEWLGEEFDDLYEALS